MRVRGLSALLLIASHGVLAQDAANPAPVFQDDAPLALRLEAPFAEVLASRGDDAAYFPAALFHPDAAGNDTAVPLRIKTRGNFRNRENVCRFPPLMLNFATRQVATTLFAGEDRLKLVTHCQPRSQYYQYVLLEYLSYRVLNLLTDYSLRVRLLDITYLNNDTLDDNEPGNNHPDNNDSGTDDSSTMGPDNSAPDNNDPGISHSDTRAGNGTASKSPRKPLAETRGFLIEDIERFGERMQLQELQQSRLERYWYDPEQEVLVALFQYLIGNADWSLVTGAPGEDCCHNIFTLQGPATALIPVPYDFDVSGLVNPRYGSPPRQLGIRRLTDRLYRGACTTPALLEQAVAVFVDKRAAIRVLFEQQSGLSDLTRKRALDYIDAFYAVITDSTALQTEIVAACL